LSFSPYGSAASLLGFPYLRSVTEAIWGRQSLALVGPWRIRVERWIWLKAALTIGAILFGIFVIEARMLSNLALLQAEGERALRSSIFLIQQSEIQLTAYLQLSLFTAIIAIAVFKPLRKRSPHPHPQR
jgi:hypothetical protein